MQDREKYLDRQRRYNQSDKGRARNARYEAQSDKGRARNARYEAQPYRRLEKALYEWTRVRIRV